MEVKFVAVHPPILHWVKIGCCRSALVADWKHTQFIDLKTDCTFLLPEMAPIPILLGSAAKKIFKADWLVFRLLVGNNEIFHPLINRELQVYRDMSAKTVLKTPSISYETRTRPYPKLRASFKQDMQAIRENAYCNKALHYDEDEDKNTAT